MQGQTVCVYNQTNECFLSLGATRAEHPLAQLQRRVFARGAHHLLDEGCWYARASGLRTLSLFARRDLIYLDDHFRVVSLVESFPILRTAMREEGASSMLALPVHTISSSRTRVGNQLVICAPEEMEGRLRRIRERGNAPRPAQAVMDVSILPQHQFSGTEKKRSALERAMVSDDGRNIPGVHVIRDINATGLYLVTKERWPVGSEVRMSLQRAGVSQTTQSAITLQMRVTRWGADGVGLEFAGPVPMPAGLATMYPC